MFSVSEYPGSVINLAWKTAVDVSKTDLLSAFAVRACFSKQKKASSKR
ncbi:MAG: hypothetical protein RQ739_04625 [Desulfotignum sp.]|nr:hypothetical protein [Desulfotignum sp.]